MKKFFSLLFALCTVTALTFAQENTAEDLSSGPVMEFESTTIDYGKIEQGSDPLRKFHFTNTGTEPLIIKNAKGSCGCTVPKWPKEPIMPGEAGVLEVRYDTKRMGRFQKSVTVTTNEANSTHRLTIKGETYAPAPEESVPAGEENMLSPNNG